MATSKKESSDRRKLALLIGNSDYSRPENKLRNPTQYVKELGNSLEKINFTVTTASNLDKRQMKAQITDFSKTISDGDLILIYFFGQGYQVNEKNYLIPAEDTRIKTPRDVEDFAVDLESTLKSVAEKNKSYVTILILDCCRPYVLNDASGASSNVGRNGLCEMKPSNGVFIQFSCAANQAVNNDLFTKHLLKNIVQENVDVGDIFRDIADKVYRESNQRQKPLTMSGLQQHRQVYLHERDLTTAKYLSKEPLSSDEKEYYEECKEYYRLTNQPLIAVDNEILDNNNKVETLSLKFGIDEDCNKFDLREFLTEFCDKANLNIRDLAVKQIQEGSSMVQIDLPDKVEGDDSIIIRLKMFVHKLTDKFKEELGKMKIFFMFMGRVKSLLKMQKHRTEIRLNPAYNRIYTKGHDYWLGPLIDGKDRGDKPYYCPVGWQRWSLYVTDQFDTKFKGWCIGYHGTKFSYGLSILLSGLKPADVHALGEGVYLTPSINYAAHPRYSEIKLIESKERKKFFKSGKYIQFVLECRVHPSNIITIGPQTLRVSKTTIDPNINNHIIEWVIDTHGKKILDFNDPYSPIVCTGLLTRVTDEHPSLLPESDWWFDSLLTDENIYKPLKIDFKSIQKQKQRGDTCKIIFD